MTVGQGSSVVNASTASEPRIVVRGGEPLRVYRRPEDRRMLFAGITLITVSVAVPLAKSMFESPPPIAGIPLFVLFLCIPAALFWWNRRLGVYVSKSGVRNVGIGRTSFTEWPDIVGFVVDNDTSLSVCVHAEHADGSRTPLTALARWARWKNALIPYCEALNNELAAAHAGTAEPTQ
jgi:hypothetical protein